jgi:cholesterol oxidase
MHVERVLGVLAVDDAPRVERHARCCRSSGGFEVHARQPGWMQRAAHLDHHTFTADQVIVSAHAYGSAKLLHRLKHAGALPGLSDQLGQGARTNSEQLISITRPYADWKRDPDKVHITHGMVLS